MVKQNDRPRDRTKQEDVTQKLQGLAHQLGPGAQLPTFVGLRRELGISGTTLNAALDELERQNVIVRRHGVGIYVSEHLHRRNLVLLCDPVFFEGEVSPFWEMMVRHAHARAADKSENLVLHFARQGEASKSTISDALLTDLNAQRVHGVLGVGLTACIVQDILARQLPFVAFAGYGPCAVSFREEATVRLGVEALAARGCRRIALWSSVPSHRPLCHEEALRRPTLPAFQAALAAQDLAFDPALVRINAHLCPDDLSKDVMANISVPSAQEQGQRTVWEVFGPESDPISVPMASSVRKIA